MDDERHAVKRPFSAVLDGGGTRMSWPLNCTGMTHLDMRMNRSRPIANSGNRFFACTS